MQQAQAASWASSVGSLLNSQLGREILADVLDAASAVLRRDRRGQQVERTVNAVADAGSDIASTAVDVSTDIASGAVEAGATIASAVTDMAETAAGTLASMATGAVLDMVGGEAEDNTSNRGEGRARKPSEEEDASS